MHFRPLLTREQVEELRIHRGDSVVINGERYVAKEVGLKYVSLMRPDGTPVPGLVHQRYVIKPDNNVPTSPLDDMVSCDTFDRDSLIPRRRRY